MRKNYLLICAFAAVCVLGLSVQSSLAQGTSYTSTFMRNIEAQNSAARFSTKRIQNQNLTQAVSRVGVAGINQRNFASGIGQLAAKNKPFSGVNLGPSVSPYLSLTNPLSQASDYYTIVKPLQEQRRQNERFAQQQYMQERRLNQVAAQGPYSVQGDEDTTPTGHPVARMYFSNFNTTGNYFPPPTRSKQDQ